MMNFDDPLQKLIADALNEDAGSGDYSTLSCISPETKGKAVLHIKQEGIIAGIQVAEQIFIITNDLPKKEDYGLTSQIRRASVSVSANIAEAFGRSTSPDKSKFYDYSRGSAFETKSLLIYGNKVGYFETESTQNLIEKLNVVIYNLNKVKLALANKIGHHPLPLPKPMPQPLP